MKNLDEEIELFLSHLSQRIAKMKLHRFQQLVRDMIILPIFLAELFTHLTFIFLDSSDLTLLSRQWMVSLPGLRICQQYKNDIE